MRQDVQILLLINLVSGYYEKYFSELTKHVSPISRALFEL